MNETPPTRSSNLCCRVCGHAGADLRLVGCNCVLHAKCTPLSIVVAEGISLRFNGIPSAVTAPSVACPVCCNGIVNGIHLFGMPSTDLERAVELRKQCAQASAKSPNTKDQRKRSRDAAGDEAVYQQIQAEASSLLLSHTRSGVGSNDTHNHRTGRWSPEEVAFVDQLVTAFDQGSLPLPHGVKLNEFLGDMLLCKSSRLTKKMKNAKLSSRSFALHPPHSSMKSHCCATLSTLQEQFLASIPSEAMQLELRFNMSKLWRMHFSNLCLQVGYEKLDARDWVSSLEEMEQRASEAEELIRRARRRRMGLALRQDVGQQANPGVFIQGRPARETAIPVYVPSSQQQQQQQPHQQQGVSREAPRAVIDFNGSGLDGDFQRGALVSDDSTKQDDDEADFLANVLDLSNAVPGSRQGDLNDDYLLGIEELADPLSHFNDISKQFGDSGPFLEKVIGYMESEELPFEHADIWVPSMTGNDGKKVDARGGLQLFHAGHATRSDLETSIAFKMNEYGMYSQNFSFAPGVGLPGRVYSSGQPSWEGSVDEADPTYFERAGGAKVYGVRCALGIPLHTTNIGRIVLALYSTSNVPENKQLTAKFLADFAKWVPQPKWKLVIDLGSTETNAPVVGNGNPFNSMFAGDETVSAPSSAFGATNGLEEQTNDRKNDEEDRIACLLGDHMPAGDTSESSAMLPHFMSLRLLLLRSQDRRTAEEKELLEIVKKSFRGFSKDNKRGGAELANLLAKDWMYLFATMQASVQTSPSFKAVNSEQHQCHVMQAPLLQTTSNGTPTTMPSVLGPSGLATSHQQILPLSTMSASGSRDTSKITHHHHHHHNFEENTPVAMHTSKQSFPDGSVEQMHVVPEA